MDALSRRERLECLAEEPDLARRRLVAAERAELERLTEEAER